ncbi:hypothetical protein NQZ68_000064 [Dissostichus eleginoides]|uniref:Amphoterin-induced protein 3 n=1 Tax=Dissostichus eleginoides TaxID=100907 RepID=A0AAD9C9F4_DISEL|nr:hypothetical protein NQZ68_000064 [Dissostichus eleginoides]KAK1898255.1 Amphoterin-induced protein 3 [Dissostichus eleginoides]
MTFRLYPLLVLLCLLHGSEGVCPPMCICVSDTAGCSSCGLTKIPQSLPTYSVILDLSHNYLSWLGVGSFKKMPKLEKLLLTHNELVSLDEGVFTNASSLRYLDLSSNKLRVVEQHYFQGLWKLEELLLFNNKITQLEAGMLNGLSSLKKAYFSLNQITYFPFFSITDHSHPFMSMLDLSSNRLSRLPWVDVKALPMLVQRGLYLHNNSLICDCSMYSVFWHWDLRGYETLRDFTEEHTCTIYGNTRSFVRFLRQPRFFRNCTVEKPMSLPVTVFLSKLTVTEGEMVRLDCETSLSSRELSFAWLTPSKGYITQTSINDTLMSLFPNGTLDIQATKVNDSGLYVCTAQDMKHALNATREVNVTVVLPQTETFNTGYTTLIACMFSMLFIFVYLYLTPCRCSCCTQPGPRSVFSSSRRSHCRSQSSKRVAFMEPMLTEEKTEWPPKS